MNLKTQIVNRTKALSTLDKCYNRDVDKIKLSSANTKKHEMKKCEICYELLKEGKHFITEAHFTGGRGRCDVLCLDDNLAIEIVKSETEKSLFQKQLKYPVDLRVVYCEE